jgi:AcrR family transcriptional regulator
MTTNAATDHRLRRVVEAAGFCFSEKSIKATTMDEIAEAAGVSKPFLYKYFESKNLLADAVVAEALDSWHLFSEEAAGQDTKVVDQMAARMRATASFVTERPVLRTLLRQDHTARATHGRHFRQARERSLHRTRALVREGVERGELAPDVDLEATARVIEILTHGLVQSLLGLHVIAQSAGMIEVAVALMHAGLPRPPTSTVVPDGAR